MDIEIVDQDIVVKMRIMVAIAARFNTKIVNLLNFAKFDEYALEVKIMLACNATVQSITTYHCIT